MESQTYTDSATGGGWPRTFGLKVQRGIMTGMFHRRSALEITLSKFIPKGQDTLEGEGNCGPKSSESMIRRGIPFGKNKKEKERWVISKQKLS